MAGDRRATPRTGEGPTGLSRSALLAGLASRAWSLRERPGLRRDLIVVAYGLVAGAVAAARVSATMPATPVLMEFRRINLAATLAADKVGHGPLVGATPRGFFPAGISDDLGLYLLLPKVAA